MDNNDGNDYGNEDYDPNAANNNGDDGDNNAGGNDENVDQYFDDAGDIGYLPADHVRLPFISLTAAIASDATPAKRLDQAAN